MLAGNQTVNSTLEQKILGLARNVELQTGKMFRTSKEQGLIDLLKYAQKVENPKISELFVSVKKEMDSSLAKYFSNFDIDFSSTKIEKKMYRGVAKVTVSKNNSDSDTSHLKKRVYRGQVTYIN